MTETLKPDICVIGAGSGGLSVTAGALQFGLDVVLVERGEMGGDCLNFGCVPSKALIAAARRKHDIETAAAFGLSCEAPVVDFAAVNAHVKGVIAAIAPNDSVGRYTAMGATVIRGTARFRDRKTVEVGDRTIVARRFVVATGSSPAVPPIPGLDEVPYFTNESIFDNATLPHHLVIVGGGPIGLELAQAHRRLGSRVTVLEAASPMAKDDPELAELVLDRLRSEGVEILSGAKVTGVTATRSTVTATIEDESGERSIAGSHLLVAAGRKANVDDLGLDAAGIRHDRGGIEVNARLKTTNRRVYAVGDVAGGLQFTHAANYHAGIVLRNIMFRLRARVRENAVPWVTYTDPELAWVGMGEEAARKAHREVRIMRWPFAENDRAQAERATGGLVKVVTEKNGRVLGAGIVGAHAGELIGPWVRAVAQREKIGALTSPVVPYPTLAEANKRAAYAYYAPILEQSRLPRLARFLTRLF